MPSIFFPACRKSSILNFDEHELATLIYGTFPPAVAEMARDFILELKVSGEQFMQIEAEKLHILANDNVDALEALRNLRQSPPECILALLSTARPSPSIPVDFRQMAPFSRQKGFVVVDVNDEEAYHDDPPTAAPDDLADWDYYQTFGLNVDHQPSCIKPTSNMPPQSIDEPPASADWHNPSRVLPPTDARESPISRHHSEPTVTCHPTASVISASETSSPARNTFEAASPIRGEISTDGQIIYHLPEVLQPSAGDEHVSDPLNADVVSSSPSLVKPTFNFREIDNVVSTTRTMASLALADGGKDIEEHSATHMSLLADQNNPHYNNPMDRCSKVTSPTKIGSHGSFSETTTACLEDRGRTPNLRSPKADPAVHEQPSISPQNRISSILNDAGSSYVPDADEDSDAGATEEIHPSSIVHRDFNSTNNLLIEDTNLRSGRSHSLNFASHTVGIAGDLSATNVSGAVSSSSCTHPVSTRSDLSAQSLSDAPPHTHSMTNEEPNLRHTDAGTHIKRAAQSDNSTNPTSEEQHPTTASLPASGVCISDDDDDDAYLHISLPLSDSPRSIISACPLVESSQTLENLANINDQMASLLAESMSYAFSTCVTNNFSTTLALHPLGQPTNSYMAHPNSRDVTTAECFTDSDHSVMSDMSVSSAQSVIIHHEDKLMLTSASRPASPSRQTNSSLCDVGKPFTARPSRVSLPACHQASMFLPDDNSGYLASFIDSHINGTSPGSTAENTLAAYQDTCPGLEVLDGGAKQARYSQTQVDVGTVPELRLAFNLDVRPKHVETNKMPYSNTDRAAGCIEQDDAQVSSKFVDWKTQSKIDALFLPRIPLSPSFSQEMSSSLESLSVDRPAYSLHVAADAIPSMPKPPRCPRRALPATPRTLWPISDDLPGKPRMSGVSYGRRRPPVKRRLKTLSSPSLANVQAGRAKNTPFLTYCDAATQTELECQRTLLKIQADDQRRELPISRSTTSFADGPSPSFLGGVHKIFAGILPKETPKPKLHSAISPRLRVDVTSRGLFPSSQGPMSALFKVSDV